MAKTASQMLELDTILPEFTLPDVVTGEMFHSKDIAKNETAVIMFICNHCPYVIHIRNEIVKLAREYISKGIKFIAINSNDVASYPDDRPEAMIKLAKELDMPFPYLFDESQEVAKAFHAACTPDFFVFKEHKLVYRGQFDDSRPGNGKPVTGQDLRQALNNLIADKKPSKDQFPSLGCNIKWKAGNEPSFAAH